MAISKSSQTESVTSYALMFVTCLFCPLESNPLLSLYNGSSFPAATGSTTGPNVLERHVGWSVICLVFERLSGNSTLVAAVLFPRTEEITRSQVFFFKHFTRWENL